MKMLNPEIIEQEEQRLLVSIVDSLDFEAAREVFEKESDFALIEKTKIQSSDIVVFGSEIAFKLQFVAPVSFSLLIDRLGNYLEMANQNHEPDVRPAIREYPKPLMDPEIIQKSEKEIIEKIAVYLQEEQIRELFEQKFNFYLDGEVQLKNGQMMIHENSITYKLNYDAQLKFELLLDRFGNCLKPNITDKISRGDNQVSYSDAIRTEPYESIAKIE